MLQTRNLAPERTPDPVLVATMPEQILQNPAPEEIQDLHQTPDRKEGLVKNPIMYTLTVMAMFFKKINQETSNRTKAATIGKGHPTMTGCSRQ
jgi:hypothetical protein